MSDPTGAEKPFDHADRQAYEQCMDLFDRAMQQPADDRTAFVRREAGPDQRLARQVLKMIEEFTWSEDPLRMPASPPDEGSLLGVRIGPYLVLRRLKPGGMGEVYHAVREGDFEYPVAIKVIQAAIAGPIMVERFRQERQILASLEHANIARLLDGGSLADGRPYLVMEFIDGVPVTEFCDKRQLSIPERLKLFITICDAVQYAHRQLVIHRDIKPANILINADGVPKLLDFGIAKLLSPAGLGLFDLTTSGIPGTPLYASPEHLRGDAVQTTSDVFLLGVLLYEMLTGSKPFSREETEDRSRREVLPARPSVLMTGMGACGEAPGEIEARARIRKTTPARLARSLRGDLDDIIMTALRWDPRLRYQSVDALRDEIGRHLNHLPVVARPKRLPYVAGRFVRRHRAVAAGVLLLTASLVLGFAGTLYQWSQAEELRRAAEQRDVVGAAFFEGILERVATALERNPADVESQRGFMQQATQYLGRRQQEAGRNLKVIKSVATGYGRVADLQGNPGRVNVGETDDALVNYDHSVQLMQYVRASEPGDRDALLGISVSNVTMGDIYVEQNKPELARERYEMARQAAAALVQLQQDEVARRQLETAEKRLTGEGVKPPVPADVPPDPPAPAPPRRESAPAPPRSQAEAPLPEPPPDSSLPPPPPTAALNTIDAGWIRIAGGRFDMGCQLSRTRQCPPDEQPQHAVTIDALDLMAAETTVTLFSQHAAAAGLSVPTQPVWSTSEDLPVVGVSWQDAVRFCGAIGGRLPTEAEWEYAARGGHPGSLYPWGDTQDRRRANGGFPWRDGHDFPVAATTFMPNDFGLYNTVGNVWEWVNDWYEEAYYGQSQESNPQGPPAGTRHLIRGGSFHTPPEFLRLTKRATEAVDPSFQMTGFRCARGHQ